MNTGFKANKNVVCFCKYNVVRCPKYSRKVLVGDVERRLRELIFGVYSEHPAKLIEMEIMPDHVHLRLEPAPQFGVHKLIKRI